MGALADTWSSQIWLTESWFHSHNKMDKGKQNCMENTPTSLGISEGKVKGKPVRPQWGPDPRLWFRDKSEMAVTLAQRSGLLWPQGTRFISGHSRLGSPKLSAEIHIWPMIRLVSEMLAHTLETQITGLSPVALPTCNSHIHMQPWWTESLGAPMTKTAETQTPLDLWIWKTWNKTLKEWCSCKERDGHLPFHMKPKRL